MLVLCDYIMKPGQFSYLSELCSMKTVTSFVITFTRSGPFVASS